MLSATEVKRQLLASDGDRPEQPNDWEAKKKDYAEVGAHVKRMQGTAGWKIVEHWLMRQLDINTILRGTDRERARAEGIADVLRQVNYMVTMGEAALSELEDKPE